MTESVAEMDVLTLAVLLPASEQEREAFFDLVANSKDLCGTMPLSAMHGNLINYVRAQDAVASDEPAAEIYERLSAETAMQVSKALANRSTESIGDPDISRTPVPASKREIFKFGMLMFVLGALVSYNFSNAS